MLDGSAPASESFITLFDQDRNINRNQNHSTDFLSPLDIPHDGRSSLDPSYVPTNGLYGEPGSRRNYAKEPVSESSSLILPFTSTSTNQSSDNLPINEKQPRMKPKRTGSNNPSGKRTWSAEEDELLRDAVKSLGTEEFDVWGKIAKLVPGRSTKACRKRWYHSLDPEVKKGQWTAEEDEKLKAAVNTFGTHWTRVALDIPGRTDDQCAKRWKESLDPSIVRTEWTSDEDALLLHKYAEHGPQWQVIAKFFPGRPGLHIRNRFRKLDRMMNSLRKQQLAEQSKSSSSSSANDIHLPDSQTTSIQTDSTANDHVQSSTSDAACDIEVTMHDNNSAAVSDFDPETASSTLPSLSASASNEALFAAAASLVNVTLPSNACFVTSQSSQPSFSFTQGSLTAAPFYPTTSMSSLSFASFLGMPSLPSSAFQIKYAPNSKSSAAQALRQSSLAAHLTTQPYNIDPSVPTSYDISPQYPPMPSDPSPPSPPANLPSDLSNTVTIDSVINSLKPYGCGYANCDCSFDNPIHLSQHIKAQHAFPPYSSTPAADSAATTHTERPYKCNLPHCSKTYKNINGLQYHVQQSKTQIYLHDFPDDIDHLINSLCSNLPPNSDSTGSYSVTKSRSNNANKSTSKSIILTAMDKPWKCTVKGCKKSYLNVGGLQYHLKKIHAWSEVEVARLIRGVPSPSGADDNSQKSKRMEESVHADKSKSLGSDRLSVAGKEISCSSFPESAGASVVPNSKHTGAIGETPTAIENESSNSSVGHIGADPIEPFNAADVLQSLSSTPTSSPAPSFPEITISSVQSRYSGSYSPLHGFKQMFVDGYAANSSASALVSSSSIPSTWVSESVSSTDSSKPTIDPFLSKVSTDISINPPPLPPTISPTACTPRNRSVTPPNLDAYLDFTQSPLHQFAEISTSAHSSPLIRAALEKSIELSDAIYNSSHASPPSNIKRRLFSESNSPAGADHSRTSNCGVNEVRANDVCQEKTSEKASLSTTSAEEGKSRAMSLEISTEHSSKRKRSLLDHDSKSSIVATHKEEMTKEYNTGTLFSSSAQDLRTSAVLVQESHQNRSTGNNPLDEPTMKRRKV